MVSNISNVYWRSRHLTYSKLSQLLDRLNEEEQRIAPGVLRQVIELAIEIAREGREGKKIGAMFVVGDEDSVLEHSKTLILDPLYGHSEEDKMIDNPNMRETIKELALLDGAFVVSSHGAVLSATRYIDAHSKNTNVPLGLGSRHIAAASITVETDAVAVVVSESSVVRLVNDGKIVAEIIPELWLLQRIRSSIDEAEVQEIEEENVAVISEKKK